MRTLMPRIPHLPGSKVGRGDLVLTPAEARSFFCEPVIVLEKLDGVSITLTPGPFDYISLGFRAGWQHALRGRLLRAVEIFVALHAEAIAPLARRGYSLVGEWMWHELGVAYDRLPAAAVFHSVCDARGRFLSERRAVELLTGRGLACNPILFEGVLGERPLSGLCRRSSFGAERAEGLIVQRNVRGRLHMAKWVRADHVKVTRAALSGATNQVREPRRAQPSAARLGG